MTLSRIHHMAASSPSQKNQALRKIKHWPLCTLLTRLIKIGAKVVRQNRVVTFQIAEIAVSEEVWAEMLSPRIRFLTKVPG